MRKLLFVLPCLISFALAQNAPKRKPDLARGEEVATEKCDTCHTLRDSKGDPVVGRFAGGKILGKNTTANITPDPSGISYFDEEMLLKTLRTGRVGARKLDPEMQPPNFEEYTDDDIRDVYAYLRTVPPIKHRVDNTEPPTYCKVCRQKHGGGDTN